MRLKIFLFPLVLVVAVSLGIGFIWPAITDLRSNISTLQASQKTLASYENKKSNVTDLTADLNQHKTSEDFIQGFLPLSLKEELLINWISKLAADNELSISGISFRENKVSTDADNASALAISSLQAVSTADANAPSATIVTPEVANTGKLAVKKTTASISVIGKYDKILEMLKSLYYTERLNETTVASISRVTESVTGTTPVTAPEEGVLSDFLQLNIDIDFSYAPVSSLGGNYAFKVFDAKTFNYAPVETIQKQIKEMPEIRSFVAGDRNNPFLP